MNRRYRVFVLSASVLSLWGLSAEPPARADEPVPRQNTAARMANRTMFGIGIL